MSVENAQNVSRAISLQMARQVLAIGRLLAEAQRRENLQQERSEPRVTNNGNAKPDEKVYEAHRAY